ncbi:MAG: proton-conducting membrane transporter, partial [bacterium]|nr:proton-conducting membrane transporter [bacterium]
MCHREPLVEIVDAAGRRAVYGNVEVAEAPGIVRRHLRPGGLVTRARWTAGTVAEWFSPNGHELAPPEPLPERAAAGAIDPVSSPAAAYLGKQQRIVMENCGRIDPLRLDEYRARDGYQALERCLKETSPDGVITAVGDAGLRGRGGAGFPTGRKWALARPQPGPKYVICNGDEGDPGAFMDRLVLEADPHRVLEGLALAAYAVGAAEGYLYIRAEYPLAVRHVREAIRQAEAAGLLGERILGTDFSLRLAVREGAGAFVCGEETALIASLEGRRGMPRLRPPYPVEKGLYGRPTVINNVETLACVPWIVRHGSDAFAALGTETSNGTKVFALAGKIHRGGLIEVPMGITIREIVEELGGGIKDGREFKA